MNNKNFNNEDNNNWNNKKKYNYKKSISILLVILLTCICLGIIYQKATNYRANISDEEYLKAKEEFQKELEAKKQKYSFYEKLTYGEKINIAIINSSMRHDSTSTIYPFNSLYTYIKKYNSNSNIYEFNSTNLNNITDSINKSDDSEDNTNLIKSCNMYIISVNKNTESYDIETYNNLIDSILNLNNKNIIFITIESSDKDSKIDSIKNLCNKDNIYFLDMRQTLLDAENNDISVIKNNTFTESTKNTSYCTLIIEKIESLK